MHRMAHPFERIFEKALKKSSVDENVVLKEAQKLLEKGYPTEEVCTVLKKLEKALIDDGEATIVREAQKEACEEEDDDE
jgi:SOS response regulatory protein OraA/RecX